jgi:hypothetical protein
VQRQEYTKTGFVQKVLGTFETKPVLFDIPDSIKLIKQIPEVLAVFIYRAFSQNYPIVQYSPAKTNAYPFCPLQ